MLLYRHYWHWPAWLGVIVVSVGVEIFMFTNVLDKKECEDLTASVNQVCPLFQHGCKIMFDAEFLN